MRLMASDVAQAISGELIGSNLIREQLNLASYSYLLLISEMVTILLPMHLAAALAHI
jgi:hypothetical protein